MLNFLIGLVVGAVLHAWYDHTWFQTLGEVTIDDFAQRASKTRSQDWPELIRLRDELESRALEISRQDGQLAIWLRGYDGFPVKSWRLKVIRRTSFHDGFPDTIEFANFSTKKGAIRISERDLDHLFHAGVTHVLVQGTGAALRTH